MTERSAKPTPEYVDIQAWIERRWIPARAGMTIGAAGDYSRNEMRE